MMMSSEPPVNPPVNPPVRPAGHTWGSFLNEEAAPEKKGTPIAPVLHGSVVASWPKASATEGLGATQGNVALAPNLAPARQQEAEETAPGGTPPLTLVASAGAQTSAPYWHWRSLLASSALHVGVVVAIVLLLVLVDLLGWNLNLFEVQTQKANDVEFVLVNNTQNETPRDPNTKNRAEFSSRSGGVKSPQKQAEAQQMAGAPSAAVNTPAPAPTQKPTPSPAAASTATAKAKPAPSAAAPQRPNAPPRKPQVSAPTPIGVSRPQAKSPWRPVKKNGSAPQSPADETFDAPGPILSRPTGANVGSGDASSATSHSPLGPSAIRGGPSSRPSRGGGGRGTYNQAAASGGGGGPAGVDALAEVDLGPYISQVARRIRRNWSPPSDSRSRSMVVNIVIARSGALRSVSIARSSGLGLYDQQAMEAVRSSAPFPPLPPDAKMGSITIEFTFDYNTVNAS